MDGAALPLVVVRKLKVNCLEDWLATSQNMFDCFHGHKALRLCRDMELPGYGTAGIWNCRDMELPGYGTAGIWNCRDMELPKRSVLIIAGRNPSKPCGMLIQVLRIIKIFSLNEKTV